LRVGALSYGQHIVTVETPGGTLRLPWKEATAIQDALDYLAEHARPGDKLATFPEASFFNFVTGLPNPQREEIVFPGVLDGGRARSRGRGAPARGGGALRAARHPPDTGVRTACLGRGLRRGARGGGRGALLGPRPLRQPPRGGVDRRPPLLHPHLRARRALGK